MLFRSPIVSSLSGSVGGTVASRNKGGAYFRARTIPVDPSTPKQQRIRSMFGWSADAWSSLLTPAQRTAWATYAANVPLVGPLGDTRHVTGFNHFLRANTPAMNALFAYRLSAPTVFNLGDFTAPQYNIPGTITAEVFFNPFDDWVEETNAAMFVYASRPQNASINYFKGPYQFMGTIAGSAGAPPISPAGFTLPWPCPAGDRCFFRSHVSRIDTRLSADTRSFFQN